MRAEAIKIYGRVTNFQDEALSGADVRIMDDQFEDIAYTHTDVHGQFEIDLDKGVYYAFYACKDYGVHYLEYWAWNVPAYEDIEINPRIDRLEIYSLTAFKVMRTYPQLMLYFRPMSLMKWRALKEGGERLDALPIIDIAPELKEADFNVHINGKESKINQINKVQEYVEDQTMYAYLIHVSLEPETAIHEYNKIDVTIRDNETGERGAGCTYWKENVTYKSK